MNEDEFAKVWQALDTRISTLNDRTKRQTYQIEVLEKRIKKMEEDLS